MRQLQRLLALNVRCNEGDDPVVTSDGQDYDDDCDKGNDGYPIDNGDDYTAPGHDTSTDPGSADN